jgi:small subunit ribosomal protein S6
LRTYEALYIVSPELTDDDIQAKDQEVNDLVTSNGGSIVRSEIWGRRKLAYMVGKHSEGCYILVRFQAPAELPAKLETHFKLSETIIRYLLLHLDERTLRLEEEQARRREEDLRNSANRAREEGDDDEPVHSRGDRRGRYADDDDE